MAQNSNKIHIPERSVIREMLPNGTVLISAPNPYNQIVALRVSSYLASNHETQEKAGMANLSLRLMSSGTEKSTEEQISERLEQNGAHYKSESTKDSSMVDLLTTTGFFKEDLETILETIDCPTFEADKLEREKEIVRMNILEQEDSRLTSTMRIFRQYYFGDHPYSWPSIGLIDTIDKIQRNDITRFAEPAFDPSQLVVTVVGGTENSDILAITRDIFGSRPSRTRKTLPAPPKAEPVILADTQIIDHHESEAEYIVLGYTGCGINDPDSFPLRLISAILGGSMDSRLFREIRDHRGLCYQVGSSYSPNFQHSPLLIYIVTSPQNRHEAVRCAEYEIQRIKEEPVSEEELNRVKTYINGSYVMSMETNMGQVSRYSNYELAGLGWDYTNRYPDLINAVTPEMIQDTARKLLNHRLLTITAPLNE